MYLHYKKNIHCKYLNFLKWRYITSVEKWHKIINLVSGKNVTRKISAKNHLNLNGDQDDLSDPADIYFSLFKQKYKNIQFWYNYSGYNISYLMAISSWLNVFSFKNV